jgi:hypothetical protein
LVRVLFINFINKSTQLYLTQTRCGLYSHSHG